MAIDFEPSFVDLKEFLEKRVLVANTEFGKLVGSKQEEPRLRRPFREALMEKSTVLALTTVGGEITNQDLGNTKRPKEKQPVKSQATCKFCGDARVSDSAMTKGRTLLANKI